MPRLDIETRRAQLIQAAVAIALRDGLDNTTVRRIATEAGVSLGTVHYCFDSKKALLEAMVESIATRDIEAASLPLPDDVSPVDAIRAAFRYYWSISGAQADRQRLVYELVAYLVRQEDSGPELARRIFATNYAIVHDFVETFQTRWSNDLGIPTEVVQRMVIAMTDGVALAWLADGDDDKALAVLDAFAGLFADRVST